VCGVVLFLVVALVPCSLVMLFSGVESGVLLFYLWLVGVSLVPIVGYDGLLTIVFVSVSVLCVWLFLVFVGWL